MPKEAASRPCESLGRSNYAFKKRVKRVRQVFKPIWVSANLPLTFALLVWELASFLFPLTSLSRIHTMITWPRLHDITACLNAQGRIVLKIPLDYRLTAVSSEHQLHSWCPWERQNGYTNSRLLWGREIHFLGQDFPYGWLYAVICVLLLWYHMANVSPSLTTDMQDHHICSRCSWKCHFDIKYEGSVP